MSNSTQVLSDQSQVFFFQSEQQLHFHLLLWLWLLPLSPGSGGEKILFTRLTLEFHLLVSGRSGLDLCFDVFSVSSAL